MNLDLLNITCKEATRNAFNEFKRQIIFILFAFTLICCNQNHKKNDLLGTWEVVSVTNIETGVVKLVESDDTLIVEVKTDSLYFNPGSSYVEVHPWRIEGDSIFIGDFDTIYIKALTPDKLVVESHFFGMERFVLKKSNQ